MPENPDEIEQWLLFADEEAAGVRLDVFLARSLADLSRTRIKQLILAGQVEVGGDKLLEPKHRVKPGYEICVTKPPPEDPVPKGEAIDLDILFEDEHLIVINKPAGLVVHPAPGHPTGTLVNALLHHCGDLAGIGGVYRPGIVHRLDKDTSGVLLFAKSEEAHRQMSELFEHRALDKRYLVLVDGVLPDKKGIIDMPINKDRSSSFKMKISKNGKASVTSYEVKNIDSKGIQLNYH